MAELFSVSSLRDAHKDVPNSLDTALKYTDGAKVGKNACLVTIATEGDFAYIPIVSGGEIQYGNKRYVLNEATGGLYCFGNAAGEGSFGTLYYPYLAVPDTWDDPTRHQYLMPQAVPVGYYYNFWLFALLGDGNSESYDQEVSSAIIYGVLGNTLYFTEREAKSEFTPLTNVLPGNGTATAYNALGNVVPFARVTVGVVERGDGPILSFSISQPMAFGFDIPARPELKDIPYPTLVSADTNLYVATVDDRNRSIFISHYAGELEDGYTVFRLPRASDFGAGFWINIMSASTYAGEGEYFQIDPDGEDVIIWPGGGPASFLYAYQAYSSVRLLCTASGWVATDLSGAWLDNSNRMLFDGRVVGGTENNIVTLDADGNVKDSGVSIDDIGGGAGRSTLYKTSSYPIAVGDPNGVVIVCNSSSALTVTLEATPAADRNVVIMSLGSGTVTIAHNGNNINGVDGDRYLGQYDSEELIYSTDASNWIVI
jgi:hypothetical protein